MDPGVYTLALSWPGDPADTSEIVTFVVNPGEPKQYGVEVKRGDSAGTTLRMADRGIIRVASATDEDIHMTIIALDSYRNRRDEQRHDVSMAGAADPCTVTFDALCKVKV